MATSYTTPGVYIEEVPKGPRPIEAVGTSTLGVAGVAPRRDAHPDVARPVLNWLQFRREYVDGDDGSPAGPTTHLAAAVFGFFQNGGRLCYVVNTGRTEGPVPGDLGSGQGLDALSDVDGISIVAAPGFHDPVSLDRLLSHCEGRMERDRVAVLDGPPLVDDVNQLTTVGQVSRPPPPPGERPDRPEGPDPTDAADRPTPAGYRARDSQNGFGAQYGPWLVAPDPLGDGLIEVPPSGHVAGVWARVDAERGVHKAPANAVLRGVSGFTQTITAAEQAILNPAGLNVLRHFSDRGNVVWGARTVSTDPTWRYLNVRRLFCMIEGSLLVSTRWIVFEPNDKTLWEGVRRDVTAFLTRQWRNGALFGRSPEEAFYVKCDDETNPPDVRTAGRVVVEIGIAPVHPAEFVVFRLCQHEDGPEVSEGGAR
jgi:hypothetical protein